MLVSWDFKNLLSPNQQQLAISFPDEKSVYLILHLFGLKKFIHQFFVQAMVKPKMVVVIDFRNFVILIF